MCSPAYGMIGKNGKGEVSGMIKQIIIAAAAVLLLTGCGDNAGGGASSAGADSASPAAEASAVSGGEARRFIRYAFREE